MKTLILTLLLVGCSFTKKGVNQQDFRELMANYWQDHLRLHPIDATSYGVNDYNHILINDQTEEYREKINKHLEDYSQQLKKIDYALLNMKDKISYDIFSYELETGLEQIKSIGWMMPFQQFWGLPLSLPQLGSGDHFQPFKTVKDYENWIQRAKGFVPWSDSAIENFKAGMKNGVVLPKVLVKKMIKQMDNVANHKAQESIFFGPVKKIPNTFSKADKQRLTRAYLNLISQELLPAYKKLSVFLKDTYLPKARNSHGISSVKGGSEYYSKMAKYWTTTNKTPEEIYQMGLSEVKRIEKVMKGVKNQAGFKGSLKDFFHYLKNDKKFFPFKTSKEVIARFEVIHNRIKPHLDKMFNHFPKTPFRIKQTEKFREESASAEYSPGSPDGSRPGTFYIPIPDPKKFNVTSGMQSLFLHEAIPGHHFQISIQQENKSLPDFRKFSWYGAYGEGWALYTESLGKELGLYKLPYHHMGALADEMHRAVRLVVDVGIHLKEMTREEAIDYMLSKQPISYEGAVAEIERYMAIPGQALSYKVGSLKIWELRRELSKREGFSLAKFHEVYLREGCMPLGVIEKVLRDEIH